MKAKLLSISTLYAQVELLEPTNLQPGQVVDIQRDSSLAQPEPVPEQKPFKASVTTQNQADEPQTA